MRTEASVTALVVAGGAGVRLPGSVPKGLRPLAGIPLFLHSLLAFDRSTRVDGHVLVVPGEWTTSVPATIGSRLRKPVEIVGGGARRQDSVLRGLEAVATLASRTGGGRLGGPLAPSGRARGGAERLVAVHDAARPFLDPGLIERTIEAALAEGAAIPVVRVSDTVRELPASAGTPKCLDRDRLRLAQTPQAGRLDWLLEAYRRAADDGIEVTDEGAALEHAGRPFRFVEGSASNFKISTPEEFAAAGALLTARGGGSRLRVGYGEDRHRREPGRPFVLAGVLLDTGNGPAGHSDADPLCHALIDALLGGAGAGSIGDHFPDTDPRWSGVPGIDLLQRALERLDERGWRVVNVDAVVIADTPHLAPHVPEIRRRLAAVLGVGEACVSVKGKRAEGLGFEGAGEGVSCRAAALLEASEP